MNRHLIVLLYLFCLCFVSCDSDASASMEEETEKECAYELSYTVIDSSLSGRIYSVIPFDTIQLEVGDTILLSITPKDNAESDFARVESLNKLDITSYAMNQYLCAAIKIGQTPVVVNYGHESFIFHVNIRPFAVTYYLCEAPVYVVDVENAELKSYIQKELEYLYDPLFLNKYRLLYTEMNAGTLEVIHSSTSEDIIYGTFIVNEKEVSFSYEDAEYCFTVRNSENHSKVPSFYADLTEEFQSLYPSVVINEVSVSITALLIGD